ncbi:MAG TPA: VCBS repeat-containing protein [Pseudomonadota bacterium]|nr:VCBS repeat-containing protein [Pseudomonadota bacterium]
MRVRYLLIAGALFVLACGTLFGNLSIPNSRYCNVGDDTCGAGRVCDPMLHACVNAPGSGDGGTGGDGGVTIGPSPEFFATPVISIPAMGGANSISQGTLYKADFDNTPPSDLFIMGAASYTIVTFSGTSTTFKTANYKGTGSPEGAAIGRLDGDTIDDVAILFPSGKRVEIIASQTPNALGLTLSVIPKALAIGDFDGSGKNDLAIADDIGGLTLYFGTGLAGFDATPSPLATPGTGLSTLMMATVRDVTQDGADELVLALYDNSVLMNHRLELIHGSPTKSFRFNSEGSLAGTPTDLVVGSFSGSSRDAVLLIGLNKLQVFPALGLNGVDISTTMDLAPYRTSTAAPLRGRLTTGRFFPDTLARQGVEDLAILLDEGAVALYQGTIDGRGKPVPVIAHRAVSGDRIVAGDFIPDQGGRDDLAVYSDRGMGGTLGLVRNNVGGGLGDLVMAQQQPTGVDPADNTPRVLTGAFSEPGKGELVTLGAGPANQASRCGLDAQNTLSCPVSYALESTVLASAVIVCSDGRARAVLGLIARPLTLLDLGVMPATATPLVSGTANIRQIEVGDVNQDGILDIVVLDAADKVRLIPGNASGPCAFNPASVTDVTPPGGPFVDMALGDMNGDSYPDLVLAEASRVLLTLNAKDARFSGTSLSFPFTSPFTAMALGDLRGVRQPEIALLLSPVSGNSTLTVLTPDLASGSLNARINAMLLALPYRRMLASDLNGDTLPELVFLSKTRGTVSTADGFARGNLLFKHYGVPKQPEWVAAGPIDADRSSPVDLVVLDSTALSAGRTSLWILQGLRPDQLVP